MKILGKKSNKTVHLFASKVQVQGHLPATTTFGKNTLLLEWFADSSDLSANTVVCHYAVDQRSDVWCE